MIKYCIDCQDEVAVMEETIEEEDYISCSKCGRILARLDYKWMLPPSLDMSTPTVYNNYI